jgi:hypothetical protein
MTVMRRIQSSARRRVAFYVGSKRRAAEQATDAGDGRRQQGDETRAQHAGGWVLMRKSGHAI